MCHCAAMSASHTCAKSISPARAANNQAASPSRSSGTSPNSSKDMGVSTGSTPPARVGVAAAPVPSETVVTVATGAGPAVPVALLTTLVVMGGGGMVGSAVLLHARAAASQNRNIQAKGLFMQNLLQNNV